MLNFALIGAAGYIAPRHFKAIADVGGKLVAAVDRSDSVGIIDRYFPDAAFFTEFEQFDRHVSAVQAGPETGRIGYVAICSPNYLHDSHMRYALRAGAHAICEKPLVLEPSDLDTLMDLEKTTGKQVNTILQLRLHPSIIALRDRLQANPQDEKHDVIVTYCTSRGSWYHASWKGDLAKSGGIATNIGVHFFDMLSFLFGDIQHSSAHVRADTHAAGYLELERARVRWFLSIDRNHLPPNTPQGQTTYRSITVDGAEIEFSGGFTELHTESYRAILEGNGFPLEAARNSIETVTMMRNAPLTPEDGPAHDFVARL
jgi:UDP-N-acetyl-2-amino-2-deoxyglucuronate dehydrogenase